MSPFFSQHAKERARERYGLDLSTSDMAAIVSACRNGRAPLMSQDKQGRQFLYTFKGVLVIPVLATDSDFVITFMPSNYFRAGSRVEYCRHVGHTGQVYRAKSNAEMKRYRRPKSNRHAYADMADET